MDNPRDADGLEVEARNEEPETDCAAAIPDATLGGYFAVHNRPPAFEGSDGRPYTVSIEVETVTNLLAPCVGYLVFPRWAETGLGIVGHVETSVLWEGRSQDEVRGRAEALPLTAVKGLLDEAIDRKNREAHAGTAATDRIDVPGRGGAGTCRP